MKVRIGSDEWWPVYSIEDVDNDYEWLPEVDIPEADIERFRAVEAAFTACQTELAALANPKETK